MPRQIDTAQRLLDVAQTLIQERGYHAFSFREVADAVGIKSASMHYHFPSKPDLAVALLVRYRTAFVAALTAVAPDGGAMDRLEGLVGLFESSHRAGKMCLCGSLAADLGTLPDEVRVEVAAFYDDVTGWISGVLSAGIGAGELRPVDPDSTAEALLGLLEGALLGARVRLDDAPLAAARAWLQASLAA